MLFTSLRTGLTAQTERTMITKAQMILTQHCRYKTLKYFDMHNDRLHVRSPIVVPGALDFGRYFDVCDVECSFGMHTVWLLFKQFRAISAPLCRHLKMGLLNALRSWRLKPRVASVPIVATKCQKSLT